MSNILIGKLVDTKKPVVISSEDRTRGLYVIGKTGTGKTTLLTSLILQDIENGLGMVVIDPHRDMIDDVLVRIPEKRINDVILLDLLDPKYAFGLNIFECGNPKDTIEVSNVREQAVRVFKKVWGESAWGDRLEDLLRNIAHTFIENQGYTITDIPRLLYNPSFRRELVDALTNLPVKEFWQYSYNPRSDFEQRQLNDSTLNKVRAFTSDALLSHIVKGDYRIRHLASVSSQNWVNKPISECYRHAVKKLCFLFIFPIICRLCIFSNFWLYILRINQYTAFRNLWKFSFCMSNRNKSFGHRLTALYNF